MSRFADSIVYVEQHAGDGDVVSCSRYRRRHIFETEGGLYWLVKKTDRVAGVDGFRSLIDATHAVDEVPDKYPFSEVKEMIKEK